MLHLVWVHSYSILGGGVVLVVFYLSYEFSDVLPLVILSHSK